MIESEQTKHERRFLSNSRLLNGLLVHLVHKQTYFYFYQFLKKLFLCLYLTVLFLNSFQGCLSLIYFILEITHLIVPTELTKPDSPSGIVDPVGFRMARLVNQVGQAVRSNLADQTSHLARQTS